MECLGTVFGTMADGIFPSMRVEKFLSVAEDSLKQTLPPVGSGWLPGHLIRDCSIRGVSVRGGIYSSSFSAARWSNGRYEQLRHIKLLE